MVRLELPEPLLALTRVERPLTINRSGSAPATSAFCSMVLKPFVYHSLRYVDWKMALST